MANAVETNLKTAQAKLVAEFAASPTAFRIPVAYMNFKMSTDIMMPSYRELRTREDRTVEAGYVERTPRALGSGRTHNHTGTSLQTNNLTPVWATTTDVFVQTLKQPNNNTFGSVEWFEGSLRNVYGNFAFGKEAEVANFIFNNRSAINEYVGEGTFETGLGENTYVIPTANIDQAVQITKRSLDVNKYQGMTYTMFCDSLSYNRFELQANQGTGNSKNLSFQYSNVNFVYLPELDALGQGLGYTNGFWVAAPMGTYSALDWIPRPNREGHMDSEGTYTSLRNPVDGVLYALHYYKERIDGTSIMVKLRM